MSPLELLRRIIPRPPVTAAQIKREAFSLGGRHLGEVRRGAEIELAVPGISGQRADLLRAVLRDQDTAKVE